MLVLATEETPALSRYGNGWIKSMNNPLIRRHNISTQMVIENGMGMQVTCSHCLEEHSSNGIMLLPISSKLTQGIPTVQDNFVQRMEDILVVLTNCTSVPFSGSNLSPNTSRFDMKSIRSTNSDSIVEMDFSFWSHQSMVTYHCFTEIKDRKGFVQVRYRKGSGDLFRPSGLLEITSEKNNCIAFGNICLGSADRIGLSASLISSSLRIGSFTVNDHLVPSLITSAKVTGPLVADYIQALLGYTLYLSIENFETNTQMETIYTNTIAISTRLPFPLFMAYLSFLTLYTVYAVVVLSIKLFQLRKTSSKEISCVKVTLEDGKLRYQSLYLLTYQLNSGKVNLKSRVKFGEDKRTSEQESGLLRYGLEDEIIAIQPERTYLHFK
jgi:hypothetical protein